MRENHMRLALLQAEMAYRYDEVPIGAIIVLNDQVIARGRNQREQKQQSISHAEIEAIQKACKKLGSWRLDECIMYVTLEPCAMCAGAILQSRIKKVVFGARDPKGGALVSTIRLYEQPGFNHYPEVEEGLMAEECGSILTRYFQEKRIAKKQEIKVKTIDGNQH